MVVLASLLPVLLASSMIMASPHYMYALKLATLLPCGIVLQTILNTALNRRIQNGLLPVVFLLVGIAFPSPFYPPWQRSIVPAAQALPKIGGDKPYSLIADSAKSFCNYSDPDRCKPIEILWMQKQPEDVAGFIEQTNTRVFLTSERLVKNLSPPWLRFVHQLETAPKQIHWQLTRKTPLFHIYERRPSP